MHYPPSTAFQPPIASLPVELLAYIFVLGTHAPNVVGADLAEGEDEDEDCQPFNSESVKTPLVFSSVSRHWRRVALSTPALYSSLCITPELLRDVDGEADVLDTTHITSYLALSRNYPIDILIDARDQEWDFNERMNASLYSTAHMSTAMALLLPHLARWRSLTVLTDLYAPMHAALRPLEAYLATHSAPRLESLRLMRCDAYAAHSAVSPVPEPEHVFLSSITNNPDLLPCLRQLTLRGVPAAWTQLAGVLPAGLRTLELSYHPAAVQPSVPELGRLLNAAPLLARLILNGSGPLLDDAPSRSETTRPTPVFLPYLTSLTLGYTSTAVGLALLSLVCAPLSALYVRTLTLEDASDPTALLPVDAGPLLAHLFPPTSAGECMFPALERLALKHVHVARASTVLRVPRLELVGMPLPLAATLECGELVVRGAPLPMDALGPALHALVAAQGPRAPRTVTLHESTFSSPSSGQAEEFLLEGGTRVRVFRRADADGEGEDDEDTVMGSESEWDEAAAFKVGGVFNDPVFDARYAYAVAGVAVVGV
ncbi:hypothetical protein B0H10DRAFT_2227587 [Mycena sp. CBHHK59/15]|nr:hypothetical protein B0H10DRAFT_2227587 [Mycena sp. CBHHK59/15]